VPRRLTNDLLLALVLAQVLGGVLGWALAVELARPLYDVHRALGVATLLLLGWKQSIALASLKRRLRRRGGWDHSIVWGTIGGVGLLLTLALGLAWTLGLISFDWLWGYSPLNVHVFIGIGLVPFVAWHLLMRRRQNAVSAPLRTRRTLLRVAGLAVGTLVGWQAIERLTPSVRLPTGSKHIASFSGNAFPAEIWLFDGVPLLDPATYQLRVFDRAFSLEQLTSHTSQDVQTVLDCTSGWWSEQVWSGPRVMDVLRTAGIRADVARVAFESATGHRIVFAVSDLDAAVLATHVGGETLSAGHGFPLRLVVPGWRGYHWVKWLARIDVDADVGA
jgi:DMSO/TMAO reductase YedYZ molybdopterin-dependent catalytic subunit